MLKQERGRSGHSDIDLQGLCGMWAKQIFMVQDQSNPELLSGGGSNDGRNGGDDAEGDDIDNDGNDQVKHCSV